MTPQLKSVLLADLAQNWRHRGSSRQPSRWSDVARGALDIRFLPVLLLRLGLASRGSTAPVKFAGQLLLLVDRLLFGVECAAQAQIGPGLYFPHTGGIVIGAGDIGERCIIYHQVTLGAKTIDMSFTRSLRPVIGNDVTIASGAKVLGGVVVGDHATVAANAVVVHDVAARTTVGGIPARAISEGT